MPRQMDSVELRVKQYLDSLGLGVAKYEPDGNRPPDFILDDRIAVEARRLNQNFEQHGHSSGLESNAVPFLKQVLTTLHKFGPALDGAGWWVSYYFRRPVDGAAVKRELPRILKHLSTQPITGELEIKVADNFTVQLRSEPSGRTQLFTLASYIDRDSGGWVIAEVIRNLNLCVAEKETKIAPYREQYSEWWLVLVDFVGGTLDADDRATISEHVRRESWDKIVLIDPRNSLNAFVV